MTYVLPEKLKDLNPYDPVTEDFRIHLDANESFCEVPENIRQEILNAVSNVAFNRYPDPYARKLCEKAGAYYHVDPKLLTAGNGSDELISLVVPYFLDEGDTMLVAVPDFSMYWFYAPFHKIKVESLQKENSMKTSAEEILQRAKEKNAKLLIFSNPCNPTSLGIGRDDIIKIIEGTDALVIVDEAYMEFENESNSVLNEVENYDNLIVLKTCSKAFGMAAIRLGIAVTNEKLTGILHAIKAPYNVNSVTQAIGCVLFSPLPVGSYRPDLSAQPRSAQLLDRHVALRDDGYRAGGLLQHLAQRTARTRLCLCGFVLRLLHLDRPGRTRRVRPDRLGHPTQGPHGSHSRYGRLHGRTGHSRGPELGRSRPFAPHDGPRHRLELLAIGTAQCHHHQLRRQRHLSPVVQSGGGRRAPGRADHEHELPGRRMVHRRTENQSQRCAGHPLHAATQQIHLHQRHAAHRKHRGPPVGAERGHRFYPQRRSAHQTCSEQRKQNRLPAEQPFRPARKQGQRDRLGHRQGSRS